MPIIPAVVFNNSNPVIACKAPLTVTFTDATPGANLHQWYFGDGISGTGSIVSHTYITIGSFNVKLVVTHASGCKDSLTKSALVKVLPPDATIGANALGGCLPFTLNAVATVNSVDAITAYNWDFGDGATATTANASHTYNTIGAYTLRLIVTTQGGCKDTAYETIRVGTAPVIGFTISPNPVCAKKAINFTDNSTLGNAIYWSFGDGNTSAFKNAMHKYSAAGVYSIIMRVDNGGCTRDTVLNNYVTVLPPAGDFSFSQDCNNQYRFNLMLLHQLGLQVICGILVMALQVLAVIHLIFIPVQVILQ